MYKLFYSGSASREGSQRCISRSGWIDIIVTNHATHHESTYIAHNMFGQIKMEIPLYNSGHTLIIEKGVANQE
jgi:hypothetical protein